MRGLLFPLFVLAFSAGVFEEIGRYVGFRCGLRRYRRWRDGAAFGLHHRTRRPAARRRHLHQQSGCEPAHKPGTRDPDIAPRLGEDAAILRELLLTTPSHLFFLAGWERLTVMILHIGLSLLVLHAVRTRRLRYLIGAVFAHTLLNSPAVFAPAWGLSMEAIQVFFGLLAAGAVVFIARARQGMRGAGSGADHG